MPADVLPETPPVAVVAGGGQAGVAWLDAARPQGELLGFKQLARFGFDGRRIPLMDRQRGTAIGGAGGDTRPAACARTRHAG